MTEFLSRDPAAAIVEIKEKLYERLDDVHRKEMNESEQAVRFSLQAEMDFLSTLLDLIERS